ncbi:hypothetical protein F2Q69_00048924 [Brassica cretica]|uniref:Uncharacterized protein n=1 Tax=Brassica cretica TaxID=69181 RepID=A0A8S9PNK6_BRACR|nr:hypothetical protein F2Q69_00048924 [Brassica cretica]
MGVARDSLHLSNSIRRRSSLFRPSLPALSLAPPAKSIPLTVFRPAPPPLSQPPQSADHSLSLTVVHSESLWCKRVETGPPKRTDEPRAADGRELAVVGC